MASARLAQIRLKLAAAIVFFALPGFFLVCIVPDSNLAHHDLKMGLVNLVAVIVALVAVAGIWYVRAALEATFAGKGPGGRSVPLSRRGSQVLLDLRELLAAVHHAAGGDGRPGHAGQGRVAAGLPGDGRQSPRSSHPNTCSSRAPISRDCWPSSTSRRITILAAIGADLVESDLSRHGAGPGLGTLSRWQGNRKAWRSSCNCGPGRSAISGPASRSWRRSRRASSASWWGRNEPGGRMQDGGIRTDDGRGSRGLFCLDSGK